MLDSKNLEPLQDRIIVLPDDPAKKSEGGLHIPDTAQGRSERGTVIAVGPGRVSESGDTVTMQLIPGNRIMYSKYGGSEIELNKVTYLIMREADVMLRINEQE